MTKTNPLASDLDFIKEFQELKIKQKLLVETLAKKKSDLRSEELDEIISKLEFLVTIFQHATDDDKASENDHLKPILERLDKIETDMNKKFTALHQAIELNAQTPQNIEISKPNEPKADEPKPTEEKTLDTEIVKPETSNPSPELSSVKDEVSKTSDKKPTIDAPSSLPSDKKDDEKSKDELPAPDFKVDEKGEVKEEKKPEEKKKKHKWF